MTAQIIDGTAVAESLLEATAAGAMDLERRVGRKPCLATVLVGDDPASQTYVRMKRNRCARVGIESRSIALPPHTSTAQLVAEIGRLSRPGCDGGSHFPEGCESWQHHGSTPMSFGSVRSV